MSEVKVNKISPRTNCGTVQLGDSGDTFTIPAGVSITNNGTASGFGATGSASWNTTVKTSDFTAVAGEGYFVNTTSGEVDVTLPAGTAGAVVAIKDYAGTFDTNAVTLVRNGSDKVGGLAINPILSTEGIAVTLIFIDSTQGWLVTDSGLQSEAPTTQFVTATGGTITNSPCGNFKIHTFTGPGNFCVSCAGNASGSNTIDYMVVAGGGSGAQNRGGGAGAGGFRESHCATTSGPYTASPLASSSSLPVSVQSYPIVVGGGGASQTSTNGDGNPGNTSSFSTISSAGGGGGSYVPSATPGPATLSGGSGGGGGYGEGGSAGNTPPVSPPQGNNGGNGSSANCSGGGGGGGGSVGGNANPGPGAGGNGGCGVATSITGSPVARAGGGGGSSATAGGNPGPGGGGAGYGGPPSPGSNPNKDGTANTGGGGGGSRSQPSGAGGSGIVVIRYKFQ